MRRFAEGTSVSVGRSRGEIDDYLRRWGCAAIAWSDNFESGRATLRFVWKRESDAYLARFDIQVPTDEDLRKRAIDQRTRRFSEPKYRKIREGMGREEHRLLALWIKAALNAVEAGIIPAEVIFLPFLQGADGRTVAETALPRLPTLLSGGATALLGSGP